MDRQYGLSKNAALSNGGLENVRHTDKEKNALLGSVSLSLSVRFALQVFSVTIWLQTCCYTNSK